MISVIIPTLWKTPEMPQIQVQAMNSPAVKEVIVISNDWNPNIDITNQTVTVLNEKFTILNANQNLYITASWNWGVRQAKGDIICLQNDDVILPGKAYEFVLNNWPNDAGIVGLAWNSLHMMGGDYRFDKTNSRGYGFGAAMFIRRDRYLPIPEDMKIWYNDDWLFKYIQGQHYYLVGPFTGRMSATTEDPRFNEIKAQDQLAWKKYE